MLLNQYVSKDKWLSPRFGMAHLWEIVIHEYRCRCGTYFKSNLCPEKAKCPECGKKIKQQTDGK